MWILHGNHSQVKSLQKKLVNMTKKTCFAVSMEWVKCPYFIFILDLKKFCMWVLQEKGIESISFLTPSSPLLKKNSLIETQFNCFVSHTVIIERGFNKIY